MPNRNTGLSVSHLGALARPNAIDEIRIKLDDPIRAPAVARRAEAELGYKAVAWQEANEPILEALVVRNVIMYTVVGAIMLVAGLGIYNIGQIKVPQLRF